MRILIAAAITLPPLLAGADRDVAKTLATIGRANDPGITTTDAKPLRLIKPLGLTVDGSGRVFVADPGNHAVVVYDKQAQEARRWTGNNDIPLFGPASLALDGAGRLLVADIYKSQIVVFDPNGKPVSTAGRGLLRRPTGVAVDVPRGRLYVADMSLRQVVPFDLQTLAPGKPLASPGESTAMAPGSVAVNSSGQVYVNDLKSCRVQVFNAQGAFQKEFKTNCGNTGEASRPMAIGPDDLVYVADPRGNTVEIFDASGTALRTAGITRAANSPVFTRTGLAVGQDGRVYLTEQRADEGRLQIIRIDRTRLKK